MNRTKWSKYDVISVALYKHTNMSVSEVSQFLEMPYYTLVKRFRKLGVKEHRVKSLTGRKKTMEHRQKLSHPKPSMLGENNPNWRGGIQRDRQEMNRYEYKEWRRQVYKRDNYICQGCSADRKLEAHHILPIEHFPNMIYITSNGITLCQECHRLVHSVRNVKEDELSGSLRPLRAKVISSQAKQECLEGSETNGRSRTDYADTSVLHPSMKGDDIVRPCVKA